MSVAASYDDVRLTAPTGERPGASRRTWRPRRVAVDGAITAGWLALVGLEYAFPFDDGIHAGDQRLSLVLSLLLVLPLAVRRVAPFAVFTVMCGLVALPNLLVAHTFLFFGGLLPLLWGLYTVARHCPGRVTRWVVPMIGMAVTLNLLRTRPPDWAAQVLFLTIMVGLAVLVGGGLRVSARRRDQLAGVLDELREATALRERLAVADERTAVARDLHDVVAHAVSLMLVQAGAARFALADDPTAARRFLDGVGQAGSTAEHELEAMLRALRGGEPEHAVVDPEGLVTVGELVERTRSAGLDVDLRVEGTPPALAPGLDLAAYRILQEALTNVLKHAGPTAVTIDLRYGDPTVFEVVDAGPRGRWPVPATSGQGLIGLAERVRLFGGVVHTGRRGPGWVVRVELPVGLG